MHLSLAATLFLVPPDTFLVPSLRHLVHVQIPPSQQPQPTSHWSQQASLDSVLQQPPLLAQVVQVQTPPLQQLQLGAHWEQHEVLSTPERTEASSSCS